MSDSLQPHGLQHAGIPVHHQLPELAQTHVHWVCDAIKPSHPLLPTSPPAFNLSQHQGLFQWVSSIMSWQIDGDKVETMAGFIFLGCKITADGDWRHEIKRHLPLGTKAMTNLDSILKSRDIILPTNVHLVKAIVFPVVMYGCESWTIKKAECWKIDAFKLWCWRRLLRVPWTGRRSNPPI